MVELPRGLEDFSLHVVTSNALTSTELMLSSWEWGSWKKLRTEELKKVHQHVGWRCPYVDISFVQVVGVPLPWSSKLLVRVGHCAC